MAECVVMYIKIATDRRGDTGVFIAAATLRPGGIDLMFRLVIVRQDIIMDSAGYVPRSMWRRGVDVTDGNAESVDVFRRLVE